MRLKLVLASCIGLLAPVLAVAPSVPASSAAASTAAEAVAADPTAPATLGAGAQTSCEVRTDTTAWCWGRNDYGQLGDGTQTPRPGPTQVVGDGWASISVGGTTTCATKVDGTLWCWGQNAFGQLGIGSTKGSLVPVLVRGEGWTSVSVGWFHACGTRSDGKLYCWGQGTKGQLGHGTRSPKSRPTRVGDETTWTSVSVAGWTSCGTRADGTAWCFGDNTFGQAGQPGGGIRLAPARVKAVDNWVRLDLSWGHTCGVRSNGTVSCFGLNNTGQLGDGTLVNKSTPVAVTAGKRFTAVTTTDGGACALDETGQPWCWGDNRYQQFGDTSEDLSPRPRAHAGVTGLTALEAGWMHVCGRDGLGAVSCWGSNEVGQLGTAPAPAAARRAAASSRVPSTSERFLPARMAKSLDRKGEGAIAQQAVGPRPPVNAANKGRLNFRYSTFNLLGSQHTAPFGARRDWAPGRLRVEWANDLLGRMNVGLVGLQEIQPDQVETLGLASRQAWKFYPGTKLGYAGAPQSIAWRKRTWKPVWKTTVPMPFMRGWRPQPIVRLRDRASGHDLYMLNIHYSPGKMEKDRDKATKITVAVLKKLSKDGIPVILTGDFNERTEAYCQILKKTKLKAAMGGRYGKGKCHPPRGARVDWIFGSMGTFSEFSVLQDDHVRRITDHSVHATRLRTRMR